MDDGISKGIYKGKLVVFGGEFVCQFDLRFIQSRKHEYEVFADLIKRLKSWRYDPTTSRWHMAVVEDSAELVRKLSGWGVSISRDAITAVENLAKKKAEREAAKQAMEEKTVELQIHGCDALNKAMMNYQKAGALGMVAFERAYLGDEMGLGKSLQLLAAMELARSYPALIICPPTLKQNWIAECKKWLPHRRASTLPHALAEITIIGDSEHHKLINPAFLETKRTERLKKLKENEGQRFFIPDIVKPQTIALDEAHRFKDSKTRRAAAAIAIANESGSRWRYCLSGTPIENRHPDLIAPMTFLGRLDTDFHGWKSFADRYCGARRRKIGKRFIHDASGSTNSADLHAKLKETCYIRRLKKDVLKQLPPKIESVVECELSNRDEYNRIDSDVRSYLMNRRQAMLTEGQMKAEAMMKLSILREACGRGKVEWVVEWINTFLESGEKFVIYAHHKEALEGLRRGLSDWNPAFVFGGMADQTKAMESKFMQDESCRVFIGSTIAAGFGLTLTVSSHIGLMDLMWTSTKHAQVFDRVHRIGQEDCVNAYYFLAPGTTDDMMFDVVSKKAALISSTANGEEVSKEQVVANMLRQYLT